MKKLLVITLCLSSLFSCSTHKKKSQCELSSYAVALLDSTAIVFRISKQPKITRNIQA